MTAGPGRRILAAFLLAAPIVGALSCSRDDSAARSAEIVELYSLSEIAPRLAAVREFLGAQLGLQRSHWTPQQFAVAEKLIAERFSDEQLSVRIRDRLEALHDPRFSNAALEWLQAPETREIHQDAGFSTGANQVENFRAFIAETGRKSASPERLALIERYDRAARRSSDSSRSLFFASYGVGLMADALVPADAQIGPAAVRKSVERKSRLLAPFFEEISVLMLRFAFRNLSDEELAAFVARSESEPGQWYYGSLSSAFLGSLEEISSELGVAYLVALEAPPDA